MVDERTGLLSSGHGRRELVLRRRAEGGEPPDGIVVEDGIWKVPVQRGWSSANDDEAYAYLVAANRLSERGGWYEELLADGLVALREAEAGLAGTGYSNDDVDLLLAELAKRNPDPPEEFAVFDESIPTEHACPRCGYTWSGSSAPAAPEAVEA